MTRTNLPPFPPASRPVAGSARIIVKHRAPAVATTDTGRLALRSTMRILGNDCKSKRARGAKSDFLGEGRRSYLRILTEPRPC